VINEFDNGFEYLSFLKLGAAEITSSDQLQVALRDKLLRLNWRLRSMSWFPNQLKIIPFQPLRQVFRELSPFAYQTLEISHV
jgi:hypothetical protein